MFYLNIQYRSATYSEYVYDTFDIYVCISPMDFKFLEFKIIIYYIISVILHKCKISDIFKCVSISCITFIEFMSCE